VAVNALNSLFMSPLVQPDWDMFHSQHPAALLHASARVVRCPSNVSSHCRPLRCNTRLSFLSCRMPSSQVSSRVQSSSSFSAESL
jgi:hypothetical protein